MKKWRKERMDELEKMIREHYEQRIAFALSSAEMMDDGKINVQELYLEAIYYADENKL